MALSATLLINGESEGINLSDFRCHFSRKHDLHRPVANPQCESIIMTTIPQGKGNLLLYSWFVNHSQLSGKIKLVLPSIGSNDDDCVSYLEFENAQCSSLTEKFDIYEPSRRLITLEVTAESVTFDGNTFESF